MQEQNDGLRAVAEFEAARIAAQEARKRRRQLGLGWSGAFLIFGPVFMVNLGSIYSFAHMREPGYLSGTITLVGAIMVAWGMSSLLRFVERQDEEIEELRSRLEDLRLAERVEGSVV